MPIQKSKDLKNGVTGDYWRIINIAVEVDTLLTTFQLGLFIDKTASDAGKSPLSRAKKYSFILTTEELASGDLLGLGDTKILDKANTLVDPLFDTLGTTHYYDTDLSGGTIVT